MEFTEGVRFDSLHLSPEIIRAIEKRNIEVSTPVQAGCIPPMMDWQDVIAKAPTGTGKTFAYGIPIVEHIDPEDESVQAVILAPTRELAIQITEELRDLVPKVTMPGLRRNFPNSSSNSRCIWRVPLRNREPLHPVPYCSRAWMPASTTSGAVVRPR